MLKHFALIEKIWQFSYLEIPEILVYIDKIFPKSQELRLDQFASNFPKPRKQYGNKMIEQDHILVFLKNIPKQFNVSRFKIRVC